MAQEAAANSAKISPIGLSSSTIVSLNIIIAVPHKAKTIPRKKKGFNFSSFKKRYANKAEINGEIDTNKPTLDARVYERAVFSRIRYKNMPKSPARIKSSSFFMLYIGANFGYIINNAANPSENLIKRISAGVKDVSSIFVDTKVMPHINTVPNAIKCPVSSLFIFPHNYYMLIILIYLFYKR